MSKADLIQTLEKIAEHNPFFAQIVEVVKQTPDNEIEQFLKDAELTANTKTKKGKISSWLN